MMATYTIRLTDTEENHGTQSITFKDGEIISLSKKAILMIFAAEQPTKEECESHPVYDIGILNWYPQDHYDDNSIRAKPRIQLKQILNSQVTNINDDDDVSLIFSKSSSLSSLT